MAEPVSVRLVESKADYETFLKFPWAIYKGNPYWVPPLLSMQKTSSTATQRTGSTWKRLFHRCADNTGRHHRRLHNHRHNDFTTSISASSEC